MLKRIAGEPKGWVPPKPLSLTEKPHDPNMMWANSVLHHKKDKVYFLRIRKNMYAPTYTVSVYWNVNGAQRIDDVTEDHLIALKRAIKKRFGKVETKEET
jgi:hypothetical protein